jgi:glucose uptake protein
MFVPEIYFIAFLLMVLTMLCWGSWANTQKLTAGYAFQLFYWDYVLGVLAASLLWGLTLGSVYGGPESFAANLAGASPAAIGYALAGGAVFNIANVLLVASITIAGMAVAFPVGIGLALVVGVMLNYLLAPQGNPALLFGGVALVAAAIVVDAIAYRRRESSRSASARGVRLSIASGILMGLFYPLVTKATLGAGGLGPYSVAFIFGLGVLGCTLPLNTWIMAHPFAGERSVRFSDYFAARPRWHVWGVVGGLIWGTGAIANFVASHSHMVGPAISYALGQGATMISAAWGVFVWREFATAPPASRRLIPLMFTLFLAGLAAIAVAPLY